MRFLSLAAVALPIALSGCLNEVGGIGDPSRTGTEGDAPSQDFGAWLSMDVAPDGERPVIAYYDRENEALGFAVGNVADDGTVAWTHEKVDGYFASASGFLEAVGEYASMKVAPNGKVWIAYVDGTNKRLKWAVRPNGGPAVGTPNSWVTGNIDVGPNVGQWASLALDGNGAPVVAYHDELRGVLKIAHLDNPTAAPEAYTWTAKDVYVGQDFNGVDANAEPVFRPADVGEHARLVIEGGTEFIAFYDKAQQRLGLAEGTGGTYNTSYVTPEGQNMGQWPSMMVDGGTLFIAYHDVGNQWLAVSERAPGGFKPPFYLDQAAFTGADTEIVKRGGRLATVYFDGHNVDMKYAELRGNEPYAETLGGDGRPVGFHNEIVRLGDDWLAASYDYNSRSVFTVLLPSGAAQ